jgi:hypothetical protein
MADDVKIPVSTPGAKESAAQLKTVAAGLHEVGESAKAAGQGTTQATKQISADVKKTAGDVKDSASSWDVWKVSGLAAAAAVGAAMRRVIANMQEASDRIRQDYQSFVGLTQQNDTRALAQIRGQGETNTASWLMKQSAAYGIAPEEVRTAAFQIESGFTPGQVGGPAALEQMEQMAFKTMRGTGAGGQTVAGLQIAAYEAGLAKTPQQFGAFLAKSTAYAGSSRMTLQDFGGIMARLLPMAVNVGMDPDEFQAMASAMSFRISDPGRLATSLEQLIRAAGAGPAGMSASEVMAFQSQYISTATQTGGPQGAKVAAEALGIAPELAQVYGVAFDPTVRARMGTLRAKAAGATFLDVIEGRFNQSIGSPEGRTSRAAYGKKYEEQRRAVGAEEYYANFEESIARLRRRQAEGEGEVLERFLEAASKDEQLGRFVAQEDIEFQLHQLKKSGRTAAIRAQAAKLESELASPFAGATQFFLGVGQEDTLIEASRLLAGQRGGGAVYNGGTHYHNQDRNDPAGKPRR